MSSHMARFITTKRSWSSLMKIGCGIASRTLRKASRCWSETCSGISSAVTPACPMPIFDVLELLTIVSKALKNPYAARKGGSVADSFAAPAAVRPVMLVRWQPTPNDVEISANGCDSHNGYRGDDLGRPKDIFARRHHARQLAAASIQPMVVPERGRTGA